MWTKRRNRGDGPSGRHLAALERPLVVPTPLPMPEVPRVLDAVPGLLLSDRWDAVPPRELTRPRLVVRVLDAPRMPRDGVGAPSLRFSSSSSRRRRRSSRLCSSSAALRSAARCLSSASASCSARSSVAPFQPGWRMRRWLCSVCDRMRVQVLRRVEALETVFETTCTLVRATTDIGFLLNALPCCRLCDRGWPVCPRWTH